MPRKARDERLDTRSARLRMPCRAEPYWRTVQEGRAIGYRRLTGGRAGTWIARHYTAKEGRQYQALGNADDMLDADGGETLNFSQAQDKAREWFRRIEREGGRALEAITVKIAMDDYMADYVTRGCKAEQDTWTVINAHIIPALGEHKVNELTHTDIRKWHHKLAKTPARLRNKADAKTKKTRIVDGSDTEANRARRASANRVLTVLKAGLSLAFRNGNTVSDVEWRRVKPFAKVDAPKIRYLQDQESVRLVNACPGAFKKLVTAGLLTGCRYSELALLKAADFDGDAAVLHVRKAKNDKPRSVPLTAEAERFFRQETAGKANSAILLPRDDAAAWGKSQQQRPMLDACAIAKIDPAISFHILRHTFASRLAMKGAPMSVIAVALGNTEAICARHYAHLAPSYVAETIRKYAGGLDIVPATNVVSIQ